MQSLGVTSIDDKLRGTRLRWFGHVQLRPIMALVRKSFFMQFDGLSKKRSGPERTWMEVNSIRQFGLGWTELVKQIHAADPNIVGIRV